eukprot:4640362-Heterocapsa_arctica.AAC.1
MHRQLVISRRTSPITPSAWTAAKLKAQPARRAKRADPVQETVPADFGDLVAMDHLILRGPDAGLQGEKAGLLIADIGTESMSF